MFSNYIKLIFKVDDSHENENCDITGDISKEEIMPIIETLSKDITNIDTENVTYIKNNSVSEDKKQESISDHEKNDDCIIISEISATITDLQSGILKNVNESESMDIMISKSSKDIISNTLTQTADESISLEIPLQESMIECVTNISNSDNSNSEGENQIQEPVADNNKKNENDIIISDNDNDIEELCILSEAIESKILPQTSSETIDDGQSLQKSINVYIEGIDESKDKEFSDENILEIKSCDNEDFEHLNSISTDISVVERQLRNTISSEKYSNELKSKSSNLNSSKISPILIENKIIEKKMQTSDSTGILKINMKEIKSKNPLLEVKKEVYSSINERRILRNRSSKISSPVLHKQEADSPLSNLKSSSHSRNVSDYELKSLGVTKSRVNSCVIGGRHLRRRTTEGELCPKNNNCEKDSKLILCDEVIEIKNKDDEKKSPMIESRVLKSTGISRELENNLEPESDVDNSKPTYTKIVSKFELKSLEMDKTVMPSSVIGGRNLRKRTNSNSCTNKKADIQNKDLIAPEETSAFRQESTRTNSRLSRVSRRRTIGSMSAINVVEKESSNNGAQRICQPQSSGEKDIGGSSLNEGIRHLRTRSIKSISADIPSSLPNDSRERRVASDSRELLEREIDCGNSSPDSECKDIGGHSLRRRSSRSLHSASSSRASNDLMKSI